MKCCRKSTEGQCDNCLEPLDNCKNSLPVNKLPHEKMKFYTGDLGEDQYDWMIYEVKVVKLLRGRNYDGSKKYNTINVLYKDESMIHFEYKRDYDAKCKYFCKAPE